MNIKPIETQYKGYRFRSRLEARWAVFFDALGIQWSYEVEGFEVEGKKYLPDFYLPEMAKKWVEIKPAINGLDDWPDHPAFAWPEEFAHSFALLVGEPFLEIIQSNYTRDGVRHYFDEPKWYYNCVVYGDYYYRWCECPVCGLIGLQFEGRAERLACGHGGDGDRGHNYDSPRLMAAFAKARGARFEHGENG